MTIGVLVRANESSRFDANRGRGRVGRIGLMGMSYGGYAGLMAIARPETPFACL
jgi:dipeptidyl aminopeptidase/acylaminoacyl peptidase